MVVGWAVLTCSHLFSPVLTCSHLFNVQMTVEQVSLESRADRLFPFAVFELVSVSQLFVSFFNSLDLNFSPG